MPKHYFNCQRTLSIPRRTCGRCLYGPPTRYYFVSGHPEDALDYYFNLNRGVCFVDFDDAEDFRRSDNGATAAYAAILSVFVSVGIPLIT